MKWRASIELIGGVLYFLVAAAIVLRIKLGYTETLIVFWGLPSAYLSIAKPQLIRKTAIYSAFFALPFASVVDYLAHVNRAWHETTGLLGARVLGVYPVDALLWAFLYSYFIISFYEYFLDRDSRNRPLFPRRVKYIITVVMGIFVVFWIIHTVRHELLIIPYFYILLVLVAFVLPLILIVSKFPKLIPKVVLQGLYFVVLSVIYELTALSLGQWSFPGEQYIGSVNLFGIIFPFEEALWILLAVPAYLCIYEFFADDQK